MWAILTAAGQGTRLHSNTLKPYVSLKGMTVIEHALKPLIECTAIRQIIVALREGDDLWQKTCYAKHPKIRITTGGIERFDTVFNALSTIAPEVKKSDWILVHDAARPCLQISDLMKLIETIQHHAVGGLLAYRVRDTLKEVRGDSVSTRDRNYLWHAMTPQIFRFGLLYEALQNVRAKGIAITDDAQAIELLGYHPILVEGRADNIKITSQEDMALAEFILKKSLGEKQCA